MKKSNIILVSIFVSILIWITVSVLTAVTKMKHILKEQNIEQPAAENNKDDGITVNLDSFSVIVASGKGEVAVEQSDKNTFQYFSADSNTLTFKNDTLFLNIKDKENYITAEGLKTIILTDSVNLEISELETDTVNIKTDGNSNVFIYGLKTNVLNIKTSESSSAKLYDIKGDYIETNIVLKDKSKLYLDNSSNLNLNIKKDRNAELEIIN